MHQLANLKDYLDDWPHWPVNCTQRPDTQPLTGEGSNNSTLLLSSNNQRWVMRCYSAAPCYPVSREQEHAIQNIAAEHGLSPQAHYLDPAHRYSLCGYVDGQPKKKLAETELLQLCEYINSLQQINLSSLSLSLSLSLCDYNYQHSLQHYWQQLDHQRRSDPVRQQGYRQAQAIIADYQSQFGQQRCLAHHDLVASNILWTQSVEGNAVCQIIDWEFAGLGIGSFDFAALSVEFDINIELIAKLCPYPPKELALAIQAYQSLCEFYFAACEQ